MVTKLILIRHAQTDGNYKKKYIGFTDIGINQKGIVQAKKLHKKLKENGIFRVYCSDRKRAIQTAKIIFKGIKIEQIPGLREMHFGIFEGLTYKEIIKNYPVIYKKWLCNILMFKIPNGESLNNFKKRITNSFKKIIALNKNKTVAIISHGGTISIFINSILKSKKLWKYIPNPATISIIEYKDTKPKIKIFNEKHV